MLVKVIWNYIDLTRGNPNFSNPLVKSNNAKKQSYAAVPRELNFYNGI